MSIHSSIGGHSSQLHHFATMHLVATNKEKVLVGFAVKGLGLGV